MTARRRPRAVVVGATFGAVYAEALAAPHSPVELVGLVSTGSVASAELADRLGVPLYTESGQPARVSTSHLWWCARAWWAEKVPRSANSCSRGAST